MADIYHTLESTSESIYKEKMSKFLAFAVPVSSVTEAKEVLALYRNEYHDARHVCWAYMVGPERKDYQSSDDGEPSGTAGKPILGQINSFGLTDVIIIVVRYFGGIKLGTSGLIVAYREAARGAIEAGKIIEKFQQCRVDFSFSYLAMNDVMRVVKQMDLKILSQDFDNLCRMSVRTRLDNFTTLMNKLSNISTVSIIQTDPLFSPEQ